MENHETGLATRPLQAEVELFTTIFHEPWWLDAVAPGRWHAVTVVQDGAVVARLPYSMKSSYGITAIGMPPLTHTLGPQLPVPDEGGHLRRCFDRGELMRRLVEQLPQHHYFSHVCDPSLAHVLPLYALGYDSALSYTLRIPAGQSAEDTWRGLRKTMRTAVRSAQRKFTIDHDLSIDDFCCYFNRNLKANHRILWSESYARRNDLVKIRLFEACRSRDAACLLAARDQDNVLSAAVMLVWGHGVMYYLLSSRTTAPEAVNAIKLLLWEAAQLAAKKHLTFDFDGFSRPAAVNILSGFGGEVHNRINIMRMSPLLSLARAIKAKNRFGI